MPYLIYTLSKIDMPEILSLYFQPPQSEIPVGIFIYILYYEQ